jgi:hypothetical protein
MKEIPKEIVSNLPVPYRAPELSLEVPAIEPEALRQEANAQP